MDLRVHLVCGEGVRTAPPFGFRGRGEKKANELGLLVDNQPLLRGLREAPSSGF